MNQYILIVIYYITRSYMAAGTCARRSGTTRAGATAGDVQRRAHKPRGPPSRCSWVLEGRRGRNRARAGGKARSGTVVSSDNRGRRRRTSEPRSLCQRRIEDGRAGRRWASRHSARVSCNIRTGAITAVVGSGGMGGRETARASELA